MNSFNFTSHAESRMAQRSMHLKDADLIALIGTEVKDGYLVLAKDYKEAEKTLKSLLQQIRRLVGKRLIVESGLVVTAYHASKNCKRRLLRHICERDLVI